MSSTSNPLELNSLDLALSLKPSYVPKSLNHLFSDLASIDNVPHKLSVLNDYLLKHQEELHRVEEFKRDLPQCVLLLLDAIQTLNNEIEKLSGQDQFDACKNRGSCEDPVERRSAFRKYKSSSPPFNPRPRNQDHTSHDHEVKGKEPIRNEPSPRTPFPCDLNMEASGSELELEPEPDPQPQPEVPPPMWKHSRLSWTQELHTKFVEVLSMLGGPAEATPKQIREAMQVEGLTNDQVKSHLQKYRLNSMGVQPAASAKSSKRKVPFYFRDFWNPSASQQQLESAGNGGGGSCSRGNAEPEMRKSKRSWLGDA
ncbi:hypothetical protein ACE6H2_012070 [Prunus campanulata]